MSDARFPCVCLGVACPVVGTILREVVFGVALSSRTCSFGPTVPRRRDAAVPNDDEVVRVQ